VKTPKARKITNPKATTLLKDKEKEVNEEKDKSKKLDKTKTTAKIKRHILTIKTNTGSKANTSGLDTNPINAQAKTPLASNLTSDKSFHEKDKKSKESKDDTHVNNKRSLENNPERGILEKDEIKDKSSEFNTKMNENGVEEKNLSHNINAKKSSNKSIHQNSSKKTSDKNKEKYDEKEKLDDFKHKKTSDKSLNRSKHEKLKENKENKSNSKIDKNSSYKSGNFFLIIIIILNISFSKF